MSLSLIIGSRASFLAKIQTFIVEQELRKKIKKIKIINKYHSTGGDKNQGQTPWKDLGYGVFTTSLTKQLLNKHYNCVVHSYKDLPILKSKTDYFTITRDDPRDLLLIKKASLNKKKLTIGTSSPRRKSSVKDLKDLIGTNNIRTKTIRGNVSTRLLKVISQNQYDGVFMAKAAIDRIFKYGNTDKGKINGLNFLKRLKNFFVSFLSTLFPYLKIRSIAAFAIKTPSY